MTALSETQSDEAHELITSCIWPLLVFLESSHTCISLLIVLIERRVLDPLILSFLAVEMLIICLTTAEAIPSRLTVWLG